MPFFDPIRIGASGAEDAYTIDRSLRFSGVGETRLNFTPSSDGNRKKWTWAAWIKRGSIDRRYFWSAYTSGPNVTSLQFQDTGALNFEDWLSGYRFHLRTTAGFSRDPSAWFHLVVYVDTAQGTASDRVKMYVNGAEPEFDATVYPSQNLDTKFNTGGLLHAIGTEGTNQRLWFDGLMADVYFLDGYAYDPSYFGETNAETGQWVPKEYTGSFGTNGYYLNFSDNSSTSALGTDSSGQGNNNTPVNFSVTAGKTDDSFFDTPTNNIATLSPLDRTYTTGVIVSEANTRWQYNYKPASKTVRATMALPSTGKIYMEWENEQPSSQGGRMSWGLVRYTSQGNNYDYQAYNNVDYINISFGGSIWNGTTHLSPPGSGWPSFSFYTGERAALAVDCSNGKWWVGKVASNGTTTWYANDGGTDGDPAGGTNESATLPSFTTATEWIPFVGWHDGGAASSTTYYANINFGNHSFLGTVPTGFEKLCSNAFPTPTIKLPEDHFNTLVFTGNQSTNARTGLNFQPDWIVYKALNPESGHGETMFHDSVRGSTKGYGVRPYNSTTPTGEVTNSSYLVSFDSNGFTVGSDGVYNNYQTYNQTGRTYQALCWNGGDTDGKTYTVTVVDDSGNKYRFDGFGTSAVTLDLAEGGTYIFNYPSAHPLKFSTTSDGTHGGGSEYTTGVTHNSSTQVTIVVAASAPQLYYYCGSHSGMGGAVNTNSTLGSSNFDGSTQSTVKVNATGGFSMVAYTGTGSTTTVGHGLGVKPDFIIFRNRNSEGHGWNVYHSVLGATKNLQLNTNSPEATASNKFNNTEPTSSVFTVSTAADTNQSSQTFISYIFTEVQGFSKFGFYDANSNDNGPFAYCGFQPAFILIKRRTSGDNNPWIGYNNVRNPQNEATNQMVWNTTEHENIDANGCDLDIVSNGFKIRASDGTFNNSGSSGQYIFIAFAHAPFQFSRAR